MSHFSSEQAKPTLRTAVLVGLSALAAHGDYLGCFKPQPLKYVPTLHPPGHSPVLRSLGVVRGGEGEEEQLARLGALYTKARQLEGLGGSLHQ